MEPSPRGCYREWRIVFSGAVLSRNRAASICALTQTRFDWNRLVTSVPCATLVACVSKPIVAGTAEILALGVHPRNTLLNRDGDVLMSPRWHIYRHMVNSQLADTDSRPPCDLSWLQLRLELSPVPSRYAVGKKGARTYFRALTGKSEVAPTSLSNPARTCCRPEPTASPGLHFVFRPLPQLAVALRCSDRVHSRSRVCSCGPDGILICIICILIGSASWWTIMGDIIVTEGPGQMRCAGKYLIYVHDEDET